MVNRQTIVDRVRHLLLVIEEKIGVVVGRKARSILLEASRFDHRPRWKAVDVFVKHKTSELSAFGMRVLNSAV